VAAFDWLWHGFLARGNFTLLTGQWKGGKTTLLAMLLARRHTGGALAGLAVQPGKTIVVTEESTAIWGERARRYGFGGKVCFIAQPFLRIPYPWEWQALLERICNIHTRSGADLVVLDPLASLLPTENSARSILQTLLPLTELTRRGIGLLALHHPGKGSPPVG
jgi:RecA-family ATPase